MPNNVFATDTFAQTFWCFWSLVSADLTILANQLFHRFPVISFPLIMIYKTKITCDKNVGGIQNSKIYFKVTSSTINSAIYNFSLHFFMILQSFRLAICFYLWSILFWGRINILAMLLEFAQSQCFGPILSIRTQICVSSLRLPFLWIIQQENASKLS